MRADRPPAEDKQSGLVPGTLHMLILKTRGGLITGESRVTENHRRAKSYTLTAPRRAKLKRETRDWEMQTTAIARILEASLGAS